MNRYVVDTNVGIVAHGNSTYADPQCKSTYAEMLEEVWHHNVVIVDDKYLILGEYYNATQ